MTRVLKKLLYLTPGFALWGLPLAAGAQEVSAPASLVLVTSETVDSLRSDQLVSGVKSGESLLLRSASSLTPSMVDSAHQAAAALIAPQFLLIHNSTLPFSQNNGALWAGRGFNSRTLLGFKLAIPHLSLIVAPEIIASDNLFWVLRHDAYWAPAVPEDKNGRGFVLPYYYWTFPIDQPMRFGDRRIRRYDWGESTVMLSASSIQAGFSNENEWWGPGIRNAIILSNNAPGFPHLFVRTGHPLPTRIGEIDLRWLVGGLTESRYFDTVTTNNLRSLASLAITLKTKWNPNLSVGVARSVYATASEWGKVPFRWFDVFSHGYVYDKALKRPVQDSVPSQGGKDQLISLFARWVLPSDGAELYAEWGRTQLPRSIHDFLIAPNHTQGYTLGFQWRTDAPGSGAIRLRGEVTELEQSATFRDRPLGSWYTSGRVLQGYTNHGEVIGASIGPGASTQWLAVDYLRPSWRMGVFGGRIRWNEDVHSTWGFPIYVGYCSHDVTIYPGARAGKSSRFGSISAEFSLQNRINAFFQNAGGCPNNGTRLDIRNSSLSVTLSAPVGRW